MNESYNEPEGEENNNVDGKPYEVERIASILAVTFVFLCALYTIFAVLLFLCHANEEQSLLRIERGDGGVGIGRHVGNNIPVPGKTTPLVGVGVSGKRIHGDVQGFITMENSSQGTSE